MATKKSSSDTNKDVNVRDLDTKTDAKGGGAHHHSGGGQNTGPRGVYNRPIP